MRYILIALLFIALAAASLDSRILSIARADGEVWINPDAHVFVNNIACADTYSRLNELCNTLCSKKARADIAEARYHHTYMLSHYNPILYRATGAWASFNDTELLRAAEAWENRWIGIYTEQLNGCSKLCDTR